MNKYLILLFATAILFPVNAQDCTQAALAQKPGVLRASKLAGSTTGIAAADLGRERSLLANVHKMIAANYRPIGIVGDFSSHFDGGNGKPGAIKIADAFSIS